MSYWLSVAVFHLPNQQKNLKERDLMQNVKESPQI
jgi:hypothetical protein